MPSSVWRLPDILHTESMTRDQEIIFKDENGVPLFCCPASTERQVPGDGRGDSVFITEFRNCTVMSNIPVLWSIVDHATLAVVDEFNHVVRKGDKMRKMAIVVTPDGNYLDFYIPCSSPLSYNFVRADLTLM